MATGCGFLWRGEACTPACERDVQGTAVASHGRVSMRAMQKRKVHRRPWAERNRDRYPEQASRDAEGWEEGHPRGVGVFHRMFTRPGDWGSLPPRAKVWSTALAAPPRYSGLSHEWC